LIDKGAHAGSNGDDRGYNVGNDAAVLPMFYSKTKCIVPTSAGIGKALVSSLDKIDQVVADSHPSPVLPPPGFGCHCSHRSSSDLATSRLVRRLHNRPSHMSAIRQIVSVQRMLTSKTAFSR
jgi:hypothetical protein